MSAPQYSACIVLENGQYQDIAAHRTNWIVPSVHHAVEQTEMLVPTNKELDILIGMADFWRFFERLEPINSHLFRVHTSIGNIVCGRNNVPQRPGAEPAAIMMITLNQSGPNEPDSGDKIRNFWDLQLIGVPDDPKEKDDKTAMELFRLSVKRQPDGRYSVGWPWKHYPPDLPTNFAMAHRRLISILNRLQKMPESLKKYDSTIHEQLAIGLIESATKTDSEEHYLPHHCVLPHHSFSATGFNTNNAYKTCCSSTIGISL